MIISASKNRAKKLLYLANPSIIVKNNYNSFKCDANVTRVPKESNDTKMDK